MVIQTSSFRFRYPGATRPAVHGLTFAVVQGGPSEPISTRTTRRPCASLRARGALRAGGVETLHTLETTLEDVFIQVTGRRLA